MDEKKTEVWSGTGTIFTDGNPADIKVGRVGALQPTVIHRPSYEAGLEAAAAVCDDFKSFCERCSSAEDCALCSRIAEAIRKLAPVRKNGR